MSTDPTFDKLHTEMFALGLKNRREVVGDAYVNKALENGSSEFGYPGQQLVTEYVPAPSLAIHNPMLITPGGAGEMCGRALAWNGSSAVFSVGPCLVHRGVMRKVTAIQILAC